MIVTLSIPIYNVAPYIKKTLLSALNQTFESIQYILVDDCGTDESMDIVRAVLADHPRQQQVRIIKQPKNMGAGAARNVAIEQADTPYLFFMDADDVIPMDAIECLYKNMTAKPCDILVGGMEWFLITGKRLHQSYNVEWQNPSEMMEALFVHKTLLVSMCAKLYRRDFLIQNHIRCLDKDGNHLDDIWFTTQTAVYAQYIRVIPEIVYEYHANAESVERRKYRGFYSPNDLNDDFAILTLFSDLYQTLSDAPTREALAVGIHMRLYTITLLLIRSQMFTSTEKKQILADPRLKLRDRPKVSQLPLHYKLQGRILRCRNLWIRYHLLHLYDRTFEWALKIKGMS